jgi:dimethylsulfoniopropionate demethylase
MNASLSISRRIRSTPFRFFNEAQGMKAYTVYNHMLLPTVFRSVEDDYWHLKEHVQVWDVACERQVEIAGPDAARLVQWMTPRDLRNAAPLQCLYAPLVDEYGGMVNDPIVIKLDSQRYWLSIADSDVLLWTKGLARGAGLDVTIREPDIWPLAVQGPKSDELLVRVLGREVRDIRFFRSAWIRFCDHPLLVARSGWSKQGGFEIYVDDRALGAKLIAALWEAGQSLNVRAGCPNAIERIEGGLLSYGNDMTLMNNPLECGLEKYCQIDGDFDFLGKAALAGIKARGVDRKIVGLMFEGEMLPACTDSWLVRRAGEPIGEVTSAAVSPQLRCGIAFAMLVDGHWHEGHDVTVETPDGPRAATVCRLPFIGKGNGQ